MENSDELNESIRTKNIVDEFLPKADVALYQYLRRGIDCGHVLFDNSTTEDLLRLSSTKGESFDWGALIISIAELLLKILKSWLSK